MTRKDYVAIAAALNAVRDTYIFSKNAAYECGRQEAIRDVSERIAATMKADNPRFDRERFLKACGIQS